MSSNEDGAIVGPAAYLIVLANCHRADRRACHQEVDVEAQPPHRCDGTDDDRRDRQQHGADRHVLEVLQAVVRTVPVRLVVEIGDMAFGLGLTVVQQRDHPEQRCQHNVPPICSFFHNICLVCGYISGEFTLCDGFFFTTLRQSSA